MSIYETQRNNRIVELFEKGLNYTEIAKVMDLTKERVRMIILNANEMKLKSLRTDITIDKKE